MGNVSVHVTADTGQDLWSRSWKWQYVWLSV